MCIRYDGNSLPIDGSSVNVIECYATGLWIWKYLNNYMGRINIVYFNGVINKCLYWLLIEYSNFSNLNIIYLGVTSIPSKERNLNL